MVIIGGFQGRNIFYDVKRKKYILIKSMREFFLISGG